MAVQYVNEDFVTVYAGKSKSPSKRVTLCFGDAVEHHGKDGAWTKVRVLGYYDGPFEGFVSGTPKLRSDGLLSFLVVDVQLGDGMVLESPSGKIVFIDGGDNQLFARHVAARFPAGALSASHTINGHSIALRVTYGDVRFNLTGDLNRDAMRILRDNLGDAALEAEIVKAPHHGSHDFDFGALRAMRPVVSSGDESTQKEHIHPRATLMAALGKTMRQDTGVVLCTELAAFFAMRGYGYAASSLVKYFKDNKARSFTGDELRKMFDKPGADAPAGRFFAFERTNFGIVHVRTDGDRVLVFTHSGKAGLNEAYAFRVTVDSLGRRSVRFQRTLKTR
jgi:hypothetical protein